MTKEELKIELDKRTGGALECFRKFKNCEMFLFVVTKGEKGFAEGIMPIMDTMVKNRFELAKILGKGMKKFIKEGKTVEAVFMVAKAWYTSVKNREEVKKTLPPSLNINRKEALIISGMNEAGEVEMNFFQIIRKKGVDPELKKEEGFKKIESNILQAFWEGVEEVR